LSEQDTAVAFSVGLSTVIQSVGDAVRKKLQAMAKATGAPEYPDYPMTDVYKDYVVVSLNGHVMEMPWDWNGGDIKVGEPRVAPIPFSEDLVVRDAKLFEAGSYPDKGVEVSEADLDVMVANHPVGGVPIRIEHTDSPFKLGVVQSIYRAGRDLLGKLAFSPAAWALIDQQDAKKLSVGVRRDRSGITEVSLVTVPRIASAQVFADTDACYMFSADIPATGNAAESTTTAGQEVPPPGGAAEEVNLLPETTPTDGAKPEIKMSLQEAIEVVDEAAASQDAAAGVVKARLEQAAFFKEQNDRMVFQGVQQDEATRHLRRMRCDQLVADFKRAGKIVPAAEAYAIALMKDMPLVSTFADPAHVITFADAEGKEQKADYGEIFVKFLEAMAPALEFRSLLRQASEDGAQFSAEQIEAARRIGGDEAVAAMKKYANQ